MKDSVIESKAIELKSMVDQVNLIMSDLQDMNVEVRIAYVDPRSPENHNKDIKQGISVWKIQERNDYL